jgi:hypothetical protein
MHGGGDGDGVVVGIMRTGVGEDERKVASKTGFGTGKLSKIGAPTRSCTLIQGWKKMR